MQTGRISSNNITDVRNDLQQQGKKANSYQASAEVEDGQQTVRVTGAEDVIVTLSAGGLSAAATLQANIPAENGNSQTAAQQDQVTQNFEAAQAIKAYNNADQAAANNNDNMTQNPQQPPKQTQKTIDRLGGVA